MLRSASVVLLLLALSGCAGGSSSSPRDAGDDTTAAAASTRPAKLGACRMLTPQDVDRSSNDSPTVDCTEKHTAETFAVGTFPDDLGELDPDDPALGTYVFDRCQKSFTRFVGADSSLMLRSVLSWAWFRPGDGAWKQGAHTWRCDVVGGVEGSASYVELPKTAKGVLLGKPDDRWLICADGPQVTGSKKIPCTRSHTWRAVSTIVLGQKKDPYPGDRLSEVRTRDFCSKSVAAWLNYAVEFDYGYTWFHEAEWKTGNRRSICWAKTDQ